MNLPSEKPMSKPLQNTLTLDDALRISGPVAFNVMLKPAGSLCNLDCRYCYYLDKSEIYGGREPRMSEQMLESVVREYIRANDVDRVSFNWHGGEPLILGLDFYRKAIEFEKKYADGKTVQNTLQTNGTLLSREWAEFFRKNGFLIGISIDGPQDIHDSFRRDKGGAPTFSRVIEGISLLHTGGVEFNTMSTVNSRSEGRGLEVYQFLKSLGSRFMQFMPVVEHVKYPLRPDGRADRKARPFIVDPSEPDAYLAPWSVDSLAFGQFLIDIFDSWVRSDIGRYFVNVFDSALANWCGVLPGTCSYAQTCGGNAVIEHNGDLYSCDHFVYPRYRLGNVLQDDIRKMMTSESQLKFGIDKRNDLPSKCLRCEYLFACNGECPKHRFSRTDSGDTGLSALCVGYYKFYRHVAPYMERMKTLLSEHRPPAQLSAELRMGLKL